MSVSLCEHCQLCDIVHTKMTFVLLYHNSRGMRYLGSCMIVSRGAGAGVSFRGQYALLPQA